MYTQQLSVDELQDHWKTVEKLAAGEAVGAVPLRFMPPWNDICSELGWQNYKLGGGYFAQKHHGYCGVYRLIGLAADGDIKKPATFNRVCGQDTTGTLYIGESKNLTTRLNQMRRSAKSRGEDSHGAIRMLKRIPVLQFSPEKLAVALLFTSRSTRFVEKQLLEAYMNSFGDTPPLNYKL